MTRPTSVPGRYPVRSTAATTKSRASSAVLSAGAKPPSSPTPVECPAASRSPRRVWKISDPIRTASANVSAPIGAIMNSWKSSGLSAWAPPLTMFIIGTGSSRASDPPRYR